MTFDERRDAALRLMDAAGVRPSTSRPPLWRLLWRLGVEIPPPLFMIALRLALILTLYLVAAWGAIMWILIRRGQEFYPLRALGGTLFFGLLVGVTSAVLAVRKRRRLRLPQWDQLELAPSWLHSVIPSRLGQSNRAQGRGYHRP